MQNLSDCAIPLGEDQAFLRTSLLPGLIAALERNIRYGAKSIGLYEIGRTFHARESRGTRDAGLVHPRRGSSQDLA